MLTEIFGTSPRVKVIDLFISHPGTEYTKTDIANYSGIARSTLYDFLEEIEEYGLVKKTKKIGNAQLYAVNLDNEVTKLISAFQLSLAEIEIKKQVENTKESNSEDKIEKAEVFNSK